VTPADIDRARQTIAGQVLDTPFLESRTLSEVTGARVWLKFENLQFTASFKERGALNKLLSLSDAERAAGVIACSAGNHAQGVAYHAQRLGIPAVIVMPRFTPAVKVQRTRHFGAEVILAGDGFDAARDEATRVQAARGLTLVHPYDDAAIVAGQGTLALEMLDAVPDLDALVIAIGGGGLIAGIATAAKQRRPGIAVIGVQAERFPSMFNAIKGAARPFGASTIADGIAVKSPGMLTRRIVAAKVDDIVLVNESDLERAVLLLLEVEKTVAEGAGAAGLAALLRYRDRFAARKVGLVLCGGNIDPLVLGAIIERGMVRTGRLARIDVEMRDVPGSLARVTQIVAECSANIEEVHHQRAFTALPVQTAAVQLVIQTRDTAHVEEVVAALTHAGFPATIE
jgi:threonine dehydratase